MTHFLLASATFGQIAVTFILVMVSLLLIGLILLQKNRGSGLSGAFGGVGGHTAFGTKTGDFLTWVTVGLAAFFLVMSVTANFVFDRETKTAEVTAPAAPETTPGQIPPQVKVIPSSTSKEPINIPSGAIPLGEVELKPGESMGQTPATNLPAGTPPAAPSPAVTPPAPTPTTQPSR